MRHTVQGQPVDPRLPMDTAIGALPLQAPMRGDGINSGRSRRAARMNRLDGPASLVLPAHNRRRVHFWVSSP